MFQEFQIAKAKHAELDTKHTNPKVVEGVTVAVPNIVDRAVLAARAALTRQASKSLRPRTAMTHSSAVAK